MSEIVFIDENLKNVFDKLKNSTVDEKRLYEWLCRAFEDLQKDPYCGIKISKKLWPEEYVKQYKITNLWKYDLPNAWRLVYSIEKDELKILAIILEWFDHKNYERRFKY